MIKKIIQLITTACTVVMCVMTSSVTVLAEDENPCTNISSSGDQKACEAYQQELAEKSEELQSQLEEISSQKEEIKQNISDYSEKLEEYQAQIEELNTLIAEKQTEIEAKQTEIDETNVKIDEKQESIEETQADVDEISDKVKSRMVSSQLTMRLNVLVDILVGASSFEEFLRIANGIRDISDYDNQTNQQLVELMDKLNTEKAELEELLESLEQEQLSLQAQQAELDYQKQEAAVAEAQVQVIMDAYEEQYAEMQALTDAVTANYDAVKSSISDNADMIAAYQKKVEEAAESSQSSGSSSSSSSSSSVSVSSGWIDPIPAAYRSAGTWNYSGGYGHLGLDLAASVGTPIYAAASGYVLLSANGCSTGYLGSSCTGYGGSWGGGNQVVVLAAVGNGLYAIHYCHMQLNSVIAQGTWVSQGDYVGNVGATGNVTGPHCHIEVFYLGSASNFQSYLQSWNGDLAFGAGWLNSYDGYGRRCDYGYGAPCRVRPEILFGY